MIRPNPYGVGEVAGPEEKHTLTKALDRAAQALEDNVGHIGRAVETVLRLPGLGHRARSRGSDAPGQAPGIEHLPEINQTPDEPIEIAVIDYSEERHETRSVPIGELEAFLAEPIPEWVSVRWINVNGLHAWVVERFRHALGFHTLAAEDVLHVPQRPAMEPFADHVFVKMRLLTLQGDLLASEQVSLFIYDRVLLSFQERVGDVWDPVRARIARAGSGLRAGRTGFLAYALLDAAVDHCFPLLEHYGEVLESLEDTITSNPDPNASLQTQHIRRELLAIRRVIWPTRELIDNLMRNEDVQLSERTKTYLRDVYSHCVQLLDIVESQRELCSSLSDLYLSLVSHRMNEVMKVLTIMASLFIPITFIAGVYGMNFEYLPEKNWTWGYPAFWLVCLAIVSALLVFFRRRGWV